MMPKEKEWQALCAALADKEYSLHKNDNKGYIETRELISERYESHMAAQDLMRDACEHKIKRQQQELADKLHLHEHVLFSDIETLINKLSDLHAEHHKTMTALQLRLTGSENYEVAPLNDEELIAKFEATHATAVDQLKNEFSARLTQHHSRTVQLTSEYAEIAKTTIKRAATDRKKKSEAAQKSDEEFDKRHDEEVEEFDASYNVGMLQRVLEEHKENFV